MLKMVYYYGNFYVAITVTRKKLMKTLKSDLLVHEKMFLNILKNKSQDLYVQGDTLLIVCVFCKFQNVY